MLPNNPAWRMQARSDGKSKLQAFVKTLIVKTLFLLFMLLASAGAAQAEGLKVIRDEEIEQALKTFGRPILEEAGLSPQRVSFVLIEDNELNAFVAGGQNIFMHTGLLLKTETPAEIAGVIAHEAGHISGGHLFRAQEAIDDLSVQAMLANILGLAAAIGARSADVGIAISSAGQSVALRGILRHTRVQETSADQAGVRFLQEAGLPVSGFLGFMETMEAQELLPESEQTAYVRTHPLTRDRVDFLRNVAERSGGGKTPPAWDDLHARLKAKLEGYLFPERILSAGALAKKDFSVTARYAQAIAWYRKSKTDKAMPLIDGLIREEPQNPYFHELKGQILFEKGEVAKALPSYAKAVAHAPKSGLIRAAYGHALLENGQQQEAITQLQRALEAEPRASRTHHLLAIAYGKRGLEGLSRLHLAEEALLLNKLDLSKKEANLALRALPEKSASRLRARDILDDIVKKEKKQKKKD